MLSCFSKVNEEKLHSNEIDKLSREINEKFLSAIKILLLGTGESGKTTIIKQMKILHINGFTNEEIQQKTIEIRQNLHESIFTLVTYMSILKINYDSLDNLNISEKILSIGLKLNDNININDYKKNIAHIWNDSGIKECYRRSSEFHLLDSAKYFLDKFECILDENYKPSTEDILHSRKITTGIHEIKFNIKVPKRMGGGLQEFRMFDVGGQRDQRNKWMQVFDGIQAVLFIISCCDYDQTLREDPSQNRLIEALELFRGVWQNRFLSCAGIIVFLNKQDIMHRKILSGITIGNFFPEYENYRLSSSDGNIFDETDKTKCFIRQLLMDITKEPTRRISKYTAEVPRECYYHFTIATDTNNIRKVFNDVHDMILTQNLIKIGIL